jgi:hypothetical protein
MNSPALPTVVWKSLLALSWKLKTFLCAELQEQDQRLGSD